MNGLFSQFSVFSALSGLFPKLGGTALKTSLSDSATLQNIPGEADFAAIMGNLLTPGTTPSPANDSSLAASVTGLPTALQSLFAGAKVVSTTLNTADLSTAQTPVASESTEDTTDSSEESLLDPSTLAYIVLPTPNQTAPNFQTGDFSLTPGEGDSLPVALVVEKTAGSQAQSVETASPDTSTAVLRLVLASGSEGLSATQDTSSTAFRPTQTMSQWQGMGLASAFQPSGLTDSVQGFDSPAAGVLLESVAEGTQSLPSTVIRISSEAIEQLATYGETTVGMPAESSPAPKMDSSSTTGQDVTSTTYQVTVPVAVLHLIQGLQTQAQTASESTPVPPSVADNTASLTDSPTSSSGSPTTTAESPGSNAASVRVLLGEVASYLSDLHGEITSIQTARKSTPALTPSVLPSTNMLVSPAVFTPSAPVFSFAESVTASTREKSSSSSTPMASPESASLSDVSLPTSVTGQEVVKMQATPAGQGTTLYQSASTPASAAPVVTPATTQSVNSANGEQSVRVLQILSTTASESGTPSASTKNTSTVSKYTQVSPLQSSNYALPASGESFLIRDGAFVIKSSTPLETLEPVNTVTTGTINTVATQPVETIQAPAVPQTSLETISDTSNAETVVATVLKSSVHSHHSPGGEDHGFPESFHKNQGFCRPSDIPQSAVWFP